MGFSYHNDLKNHRINSSLNLVNESTGDFPISTNTTLCIETVQSFERILLPERLKKEKERERKKE